MNYMDLKSVDENRPLLENSRRVMRRKGNKITHGFRCMSGPRKGRTVSNPAACSKPINMKKRYQFKRTLARLGKRMAFKRKKTMRTNPYSKAVRRMNKSLAPRRRKR